MLSKILDKFLTKKKSDERLDFLKKIMNFVHKCKIPGDYLEFGVFKGSTFAEAYKIAKAKKLNDMRFFAFDSFEGLPESGGIDRDFGQFEKGEYNATLQQFTSHIKKQLGDQPKDLIVVPGWFEKTLTPEIKRKFEMKSAAIVWIDCDLYESTIPVLDFVTDLLVDGTIIVFDDWFFFKGNPNRGEQKAFREWLAKHPEIKASEYHKYFWHGNSFIVHK